MAIRNRSKMPSSERAKQFAPFAALRGLNDALARKEHEMTLTEKVTLSEEMEEELNEKMSLICEGTKAAITYFCDGEYLNISGEVDYINKTHRFIEMSDTLIYFEDIKSIALLSDKDF